MIAAFALACGGDRQEQNESGATSDTETNADENVEQNSGENISPQLEDSADRLNVDTVSSSSSTQKEKR